MIEALLLAVTRVTTMLGQKTLTNATGFFFERDKRLYLITSRHVVLDKPSEHYPDRLEIELHVDPANVADTVGFSIPLYRDGKSIWLEGFDTAGPVDVVTPMRGVILGGGGEQELEVRVTVTPLAA